MGDPLDDMRRLGRFCLLAFGVSWLCWGGAVLAPGAAPVLKGLGGFGPAVAALVLVRRRPAERRALLRRLVQWRIPLRVYLLALVLPVAGIVLALVLTRALTGAGAILPQHMPPWVPLLVFGYVLVFSVAGEELGWRGLALPLLLARLGPVAASLSLGVVWAAWHAPLFLLPGDFHGAIPPLLFGAQVVASSLVYTHLHRTAGGSLIPAHLFHAVFNSAVGLFPLLPQVRGGDVTALAVAVGLLCLLAFWLALVMRRRAA
ncbi:CPBP family glutamic-type intramembrane protease [Thetidibacter halocola]|uniref:CPBP family intramembrane metalloprotease n=1 Tax=Thetidibacter halocola TaxID=2827239 RepID=A0A8J7WDL6_9RHOB|nr:CPBP family glutamic-type intramembrane protease [Thetidibacter halocola]MBS0124484.1 CPBP family intramembrane metalloprotease [Thetidibacter halocola]